MGMKARSGLARAKTHEQYIAGVEEERRADVQRLHDMVRDEAPSLEPTMRFKMMGKPMMGYGTMSYRYASGRSGEWVKIGIASMKNYLALYACAVDEGGYIAEQYIEQLPKASIGKSCVRFKRLADVDEAVLRQLIRHTLRGGFGI